jgi:Tol biopolymer transport system component
MAHDAVRWRRLESVVQAALERPTGERAAFLAEACGDDEDLRREAASLIEREAQAGAFLAAPLGALAADAMTYSPGGTPLGPLPRVAPGARIGAYEVRERLGAGGMGEVYRARDHVLHRDVALKVLPTAFSADRDRLARFEREARLLASLNHPHIGAVYGLEGSGDQRAIVLELIDGETLEARLRRGVLPVAQALPLAIQIADALDHAHRRGVMHRDLKPANIMLTRTGAKLLDFGLAKWSVRPSGYVANSDAEHAAPSAGVRTLTEKGTILGTLHYMAPEQLEGRSVDARADIFAFGAVLYEVLTGRKAFDGGSAPAVMAAVLNAAPSLDALQLAASPPLERLVRKCLAKDPDERWQSAHDLADELRWIAGGGGASAPVAAPLRTAAWTRPALAAALAAVAAWTGWALAPRPDVVAAGVVRFSLQPTTAPTVNGFAISPDGREIAYAATPRPGEPARLFVRRVDQFQDTPVPGTDGAAGPFFSPDGQWLAYVEGRKIFKVNMRSGGAPVLLCECAVPGGGHNGAEWLGDGTMVFSQMERGLLRLSAEGGVSTEITVPGASPREFDHHNPAALPDPGVLLFTVHRATGQFDVVAQTMATGQRKVLVENAYDAHYLPSGHLVFARAGAIHVASFDASRLDINGPIVRMVDHVQDSPGDGDGGFRVSANGTLAFRPNPSPEGRTLTWVSRTGDETPLPLEPRAYSTPRVSPDGTRLAFAVADEGRRDIFTYELGTRRLTRLTREGDNKTPLWTRDGRRLVYASTRGGEPRLWWEPADGSGVPDAIVSDTGSIAPGSWSADGRTLFYTRGDNGPAGSRTLAVDIDGDRTPRLVLPDVQTRAATVSPDGRWLALTSADSRFVEVQVTDVSGRRPRRPVSHGLGRQPIWRRDGREIVYRGGSRMFAVAVDTADGFRASAPTLLFERQYVVGGGDVMGLDYDLAPDGRFLMIKPSQDELRANRLDLVLNWIEEVKQRVRPNP